MLNSKSGLIFTTAVFIFLFSWYGLFLVHKIDLTTADLGRHLENGRILLQNFSFDHPLLKTNFYSYTQSDFPAINHHWLSGIIFYLTFKTVGFVGVHLFFVFLSFAAFWLFFRLAKKEMGFGPAAFLSLLLIPLIAERTEVRPEVFSYLFSGIFLNLLWEWRRGFLNSKWLLVLPVLQVFWTNLHIYFFLGPLLVLIFLSEQIYPFSYDRRKMGIRILTTIFCLMVLATLINPFGLEGALAPLNVFQNYGYRLVENQPVWFLEKLGFVSNPNFLLFKIVAAIVILSFFAAIKTNWRKISFANVFLAAGFLIAGALAIRNFTLFGLFSLPLIGANLKILKEERKIPEKISLDFFSISLSHLLAILGSLMVFFLFFSHYSRISFPRLGLGVLEGNEQAAEFLSKTI